MRRLFILFSSLSLCATVVLADEASVKELELRCEQAREAKLRPLRDAEIAKCKETPGRDPEYCERFFKDLGNAARLPNGTTKPRLFDDLPECVAAFEARKQAALNP